MLSEFAYRGNQSWRHDGERSAKLRSTEMLPRVGFIVTGLVIDDGARSPISPASAATTTKHYASATRSNCQSTNASATPEKPPSPGQRSPTSPTTEATIRKQPSCGTDAWQLPRNLGTSTGSAQRIGALLRSTSSGKTMDRRSHGWSRRSKSLADCNGPTALLRSAGRWVSCS
jgi:hypothetical protein